MRLVSAAVLVSAISSCVIAQPYTISTFAGGWVPNNTPGTSVGLSGVNSIAVDQAGNAYIRDYLHNLVLKLDSQGNLTCVAGNGGMGYSGDGGPATSAQLAAPAAVTVDSAGNLYVLGWGYVRKISNGVITTVPGSEAISGTGPAQYGVFGIAVDSAGSVYVSQYNRILKVSGGSITTFAGTGQPDAQLNTPMGLAIDSAGNLYIADSKNNCVRKISNGVITTVAGGLNNPTGVAVDSAGNLYIADTGNNLIRKVSNGVITTVAGSGTDKLTAPQGVAVDPAGNLYIADGTAVRKVSNGAMTTVAGGGTDSYLGDNGPATSARLSNSAGVAVGPNGEVYFAEPYYNRILAVSGGVIRTVAGNGISGFGGDNGLATNAQLYSPSGLAVDSAGNLYIADANNNRIRKVSNGLITTVAGNGTSGDLGDGGPATSAQLNSPIGVAVGSSGNFYIANQGNRGIRRVSPDGMITTVTATSGGTNAIALDGLGNLYWAENIIFGQGIYQYSRVQRISPDGTITTVAGNGTNGYSGDGGPAAAAQISAPYGLAATAWGDLFISDSGNNRIRKVSPGGIITTVAGTGDRGFSGDGGPALDAQFDSPRGLAVDASGHVYVADAGNRRVRLLQPAGLSISTPSLLPPGTVGVAYSQTFGATGGSGPYVWTLISGALPPGLSLASGGALSGAPTTFGSFVFALQLSDGAGATATGAFLIVVSPPPACAYAVSPTLLWVGAAGGSATVNVTTTANCAWTASSSSSWAGISSGASGTGNGKVAIQIAANGAVSRSDSITVAGQTVAIQQPGSQCAYSPYPSGQAFPFTGGIGMISVTAPTGCPWIVSGLPGWVTATSGASGSGNGTVAYQTTANSGAWRTATFAVAGASFVVEQSSATLGSLTTVGAMPQMATGGGWQTSIVLVNLGTTSAQARLNFFDDNGAAMVDPLSFPQAPLGGTFLAAQLERTVAPGAALVIQTCGTGVNGVSSWAQLQSNGSITGFARFNWTMGAVVQEAVVPLESRNPSAFVLYYDQTGEFATGVAVANFVGQSASVAVTVRDDTGTVIGSETLPFSSYGHIAYLLTDHYPATAQGRGTIEFKTPPGGQIATLGLRASLAGTLSTIPAMIK